MDQSTLLYDETCGFCTAIVQWVERQKRGDRIKVLPCQFALMTGSYPVTDALCMTSIQLYDPNGEVTSKGQAVARVLGILWDSRWPERISRLPIIRHGLDMGYSFIAINRHRLPGIKQWCAAGGHNDQCGRL